MVESKTKLPLDSSIYEFHHNNQVITPAGIIKGKGIPMEEAFPWRFVKSTTLLAGVGLPLVLTVFWSVALVIIHQFAVLRLVVIGLVVIFMGFILKRRPAIPEKCNGKTK
jgi:hypothetical protein